MAGEIEVSNKLSIEAGATRRTVELQSFGEIAFPSGISRGELTQSGGVWSLTYILEAVDPQTVGKAFSIRGAASTEPIATSKLFAAIAPDEWEKYRIWENDPTNKALRGWKPNGNGASQPMALYYSKRMRGQTDYFSPTVEIEVTEAAKDNVNLEKLCKIAAPPINVTLPDGRDWIVLGINGDIPGDGSDTVVKRLFRASGPGGWDPDFYK